MKKSANSSFVETTTWNTNLNVGDKLEGVYSGREEFIGKFGPTTKYIVKSGETNYGVYGSASLNRQFSQIPEGSYVWIEYQGEVSSKNGRTVKNYSVDYDDEYVAAE